MAAVAVAVGRGPAAAPIHLILYVHTTIFCSCICDAVPVQKKGCSVSRRHTHVWSRPSTTTSTVRTRRSLWQRPPLAIRRWKQKHPNLGGAGASAPCACGWGEPLRSSQHRHCRRGAGSAGHGRPRRGSTVLRSAATARPDRSLRGQTRGYFGCPCQTGQTGTPPKALRHATPSTRPRQRVAHISSYDQHPTNPSVSKRGSSALPACH